MTADNGKQRSGYKEIATTAKNSKLVEKQTGFFN